MHNQLKYKIYLYSNLVVSIICLFQLFLSKSEEKSSIFFGYSWRKIILSVIIFIIIIAIFALREKILNGSKIKYLNRFGQFFARTSQAFTIRVLWTIGLAITFSTSSILLIYVHTNPFSIYSQLALKILGFIIFIDFFTLTTLLVESDIFIFLSKLTKLMLNDLGKISILTLVNFILFEVIYSQIFFLVFNNVVVKLKSIDAGNGNHFLFISLWIVIGVTGYVIFTQLLRIKIGRVKITAAIFKNKRIYYLFFISLVVLILVFGHIAYGANDDYSMMTIASGQIDGIPDAHLVFSNVIIGEFLKIFYVVFPSINWYSIYLISALLISSLVILYVSLFFFNNYPTKSIILLVFFIIIPRILYLFNFTTTAILGTFAGIALLIKTTAFPDGKRNWLEIILGIFLVVLGGWIRLYAMLYVGLLMTPALLYIIFKLKKRILLGVMLITLFFAFVSYLIDNQSYLSSPEWETYRIYNSERGMIYGTPKIRDDNSQQQFFDNIGWHLTGLRLFINSYFIDNKVFSLESLKEINYAYKYSIYDFNTVITNHNNLINSFRSETLVFLAIVSLAFSFSQGGENKILRNLIFILAYLIGIILVLSVILRMPSQIFLPSLFIFSIFILAIGKSAINPDHETFHGIIPMNIYVPFLAAILIFQTFVIINMDQINLRNQEARNQLIGEVNGKISYVINPLVVFQAGVVPDYWVAPLSGQEIPFDYVPTGWLINSPPYNHMLKKHGIQNLIDAVYAKQNVYLFGVAENDVIEYLSDVKGVKTQEIESYRYYVPSLYPISEIHLVRLSEVK